MLRFSRELNKFNGDGEYEVTSIGLQPRYKTVNFTRAEVRWREHLGLPFGGHTLTALLHGGAILGPEVDEFFDFYAGGLVGMRGYPYYALGGNRMAIAGLDYRFPLIQNIDVRVFSLYFDKLYASVFAEVGDAWSERTVPSLNTFKKDVGAELRLESFSFYAYPTRIFLSAAYGLDRFDRYIRRLDQTVTYGKEWRFYFGILFGFDLD
jgi:outer membrane protein assembly factor BamA